MSTTITHKRLVNAFIKAGFKVSNIPRYDKQESKAWSVTNPKTGCQLVWYTQDAFVPRKNGVDAHWDKETQVTMNCTWRSPDTDVMTDCFCDNYYHTIKSAVNALACPNTPQRFYVRTP